MVSVTMVTTRYSRTTLYNSLSVCVIRRWGFTTEGSVVPRSVAKGQRLIDNDDYLS